MSFADPVPVAVGDLVFDVRMLGPEEGLPVLLLHGFPETSLSWSSVAPRFADAGLRVAAPDQRGYSPGARPTGTEHYAIEHLADDVTGLADALGWDTFHLVGHDWGAAVSWFVAAHHGDRLRSLTALSVPHLAAFNAAIRDDADQRQRSAYMGLLSQPTKAAEVLLEDDARRLRALYDDVPTAQVDAYLAVLSEPGALVAACEWYRASTTALADTPAVHVPTTLLWGNRDPAIGRLPVEQCAQHVDADYELVELDASHWLPEQEPSAVAAAVLARVGSG